jgi:hypothetical protein
MNVPGFVAHSYGQGTYGFWLPARHPAAPVRSRPRQDPQPWFWGIGIDAARRAASIGLFLSEADGEGALARRETADRSLSHTRH